MKICVRRRHEEHGATAVEYALVIGLVSLLMVAGAVSLGGAFTTWVTALAETIGGLLG